MDQFAHKPAALKLLQHAQLDARSLERCVSLDSKTRFRERDSPHRLDEHQPTFGRAHRFFYLYAIVIATLYLTYAAYYFIQQHHLSRLPAQTVSADSSEQPASLKVAQELVSAEHSAKQVREANELRIDQEAFQLAEKNENRIHFLERYIDMLVKDQQDTKSRLRELEKCDCALSCTFNGTRYADRSSWTNQCDTCTCQSGQISCTPQKCPSTNCDDPILLAGHCCPTCMKRCRYNNGFIRHDHKFTTQEGAKECKCKDGLIKCEPSPAIRQPFKSSMVVGTLRNRSAVVGALDNTS